MIVIGLTGSIAMGKSETAKLFSAAGLPVFDSDAAVHELYESGGAAAQAISEILPDAVVKGAVDREKLAQALQQDPSLLKAVEQIVHPLVRAKQAEFLERSRNDNVRIAVLDIPLLFETGRDHEVDCIVVVSAPQHLQRERALRRPGMTEEKLSFILSRQMPDAEKRARADYVVDTSSGIEDAKRQVDAIVAELVAGKKQHP
jgi:dephospho-CoA kinase